MGIKSIVKRVLHYPKVVERQIPVYIKEPVLVPVLQGAMLKNKTVFITGGASGIGFGIAQAVLRNGGNVVISSRNKEKLEKSIGNLKTQCQDLNGKRVFGIVMDNTDFSNLDDAFNSLISMIKPLQLNALVNNAGVGGGGFGYASNEEYLNTINTNLNGTFILSEIVAKYFVQNKIKGNILNIQSASDVRPAISAYQISKWGLRGLTKGMAKTLIKAGIVVNALAPASVNHHMDQSDSKDLTYPKNPSGRYSTVEEVANMVVIMISDMARMIVGETVHMTGGGGTLTFDDVEYPLPF